MIRHENDLDFMLPIMLHASDPIIFLWDYWYAFSRDDFRLNMLKKQGMNPVFLSRPKKNIVVRLCLKLLHVLNKKLFKKYYSFLDKKYKRIMLENLKNHLEQLNPDDVENVVFDHTVNDTVHSMIGIIKAWNQNVTTLALPHGQGIVTNKMTKYSLTKPADSVDWDVFDKFISFSEHQSARYKTVPDSKKLVIPSLRNTKFWVDILLKELAADKKSIFKNDLLGGRKKDKIKLLIIHTRLASNINYNELVRCMQILDRANCFDVRIKPHPRRIRDAVELAEGLENVSILNGHILECVSWSDCVMFFQSSAVYDALILNKPVLYPNYVSSNKIDDEILKYCNVLYTPDDFYDLITQISSDKIIAEPDYVPPEWDDLKKKWVALLN